MTMLTLSGWAQPADALNAALGLDAATFDYSDYPSPEASFAGLKPFADSEHVIGWSTGGYLAVRAIAAGVLRPQKLTLIAAPYQFVSSDDFKHGMDPITYQQFYESYAKDPFRTRQRFHALTAKGDAESKRIASALTHHSDVDNISRWLPWLEALNGSSLRSVNMANIPATRIIHGANDHVVSFAQGQALHTALPNATLERWEETGHAPHLRDKERVLRNL